MTITGRYHLNDPNGQPVYHGQSRLEDNALYLMTETASDGLTTRVIISSTSRNLRVNEINPAAGGIRLTLKPRNGAYRSQTEGQYDLTIQHNPGQGNPETLLAEYRKRLL